eukprot:TRINITY_DN5796_c0_g1_i2.p1 TRINITY_DN5796_c0_g1~~TRINITY_DN5796_c0_g1_i2.p1  ORF type:complete len:301 (-),score=63.24 TRINITY_DN5796_c0_g1_i2:116-1018(-)
MIRPVTSDFKRKRTEFNDNRDTMIQLEDDDEPMGASTGKKYFLEPPPSWMVKQKDDVEKQLYDIRKSMDSLVELHTALPSFLSESLSDSHSKIEDETTILTAKIGNCSDNIKKIGSGVVIPGECTEKLVAGIRSHLAIKLQQLTTEFRQNQQQYMENITGRTKASRHYEKYTGKEEDSDEAEFLKEYQGEDALKMQILRDDRQAIQKRDEQVRQLAKSMTELTTLFKDMADLVATQGSILDRIDHNISSAITYTKQANEELKGADTAASGTNKCWFVLLAVIIIYTIIMSLLIRHNKTSV